MDDEPVDDIPVDWPKVHGDIQIILNLFGTARAANLRKIAGYFLYFLGSDISGAYLFGANFSGSTLTNVNLSDTDMYYSNLTEAHLFSANLTRAKLYGADLSHTYMFKANLFMADFSKANLAGANLFGAIKLTQEQLNAARAGPEFSPEKLPDGLVWPDESDPDTK